MSKKITFIVSGAEGPPPEKLTQEDVWGVFDVTTMTDVSRGMLVARFEETCPIWKDVLPYKSQTFICGEDQVDEVTYWLEYVNGGNCIVKTKKLPGGKVAIRSNYTAW